MSRLSMQAAWPRHSFRAMGTNIRLWIEADPATAGQALADAEALFREVERALSRFDPTSELCRLNEQAGQWVKVSKTLWVVLNAALEFAESTDGLFDPTVLNALKAAGYSRSFTTIGRDGESRAEPREPTTARWQDIRLDPARRQVWLPAGLGLDFGGIAKGYTAQWAAGLMGLWGPSLVDAGGDVAAGDPPAGWPGWPVDIAGPRRDDGQAPAPVATLLVANSAVATSGVDHRRWLVDGKPAHHIIDPRSGEPAATDALTVSMVAASAMEAEVWAKVGLILGIEKGLAALSQRRFPTLMIDPHLKQHTNRLMDNLIAQSAVSVDSTPLAALPAGQRLYEKTPLGRA